MLTLPESPETALQNSCGTFLNKILFDPQATIILPVTISTSSFKHYVPVSQQFPPTKLSEPAGKIIFLQFRLIVLKKSSSQKVSPRTRNKNFPSLFTGNGLRDSPLRSLECVNLPPPPFNYTSHTLMYRYLLSLG